MNTLNLSDHFVLLALLNGESQSAGRIRQVLKPVLRKERLDVASVVPGLCELGFIEELPRAPRSRSMKWRLTDAGREAVLDRLNGISTRGRGALGKAARMLLCQRMLSVSPKVAAHLATDAAAFPAYYLARRLGVEFEPGMTAASLAREVTAGMLEVSNTRPETFWGKVMAGAFDESVHASGLHESDPTSSPPPAESAAVEPKDIESFAIEVRLAARTAREGWFGERKWFIHAAWQAWRVESGEILELPEFKARLLLALRAGHLGLTRADFTATLDPADLAQSELRDGNETFHFLSIDPVSL